MLQEEHAYYMQQAILQAKQAYKQQEIPIGAVIVNDGKIIGRGYNQLIKTNDPCAHAEIIALRHAAKLQQNYRLTKSILYVTLEPCLMCVGAMIHARIKRLFFGAYDFKIGLFSNNFIDLDTININHRLNYQGGILADECRELLNSFFKQLRNK